MASGAHTNCIIYAAEIGSNGKRNLARVSWIGPQPSLVQQNWRPLALTLASGASPSTLKTTTMTLLEEMRELDETDESPESTAQVDQATTESENKLSLD
jgi:hypothetical protein